KAPSKRENVSAKADQAKAPTKARGTDAERELAILLLTNDLQEGEAWNTRITELARDFSEKELSPVADAVGFSDAHEQIWKKNIHSCKTLVTAGVGNAYDLATMNSCHTRFK